MSDCLIGFERSMTLAVSGAWSLLVLSGGLDWLVGRRGVVWIGLGVCDWVGWFAVGRLVFSVWLFCGGLKQAVCFLPFVRV